MIKFSTIEFDNRILDALRDDKLVVFAGAGVSMGAPSNLASFWTLATDIARGTGLEVQAPLDLFLGRLKYRSVAVHDRAVELLSPSGSAPNALHHDLLRLFRDARRVRVVTTNFDLHFENAAASVFPSNPRVYTAPALPLGYDFNGIVHIHGAIPDGRDLVLTDSDFGRAYLTEGWARRFLEDVFRQYTVLFVGYSHDDVVMNYLARALPADGVAGRFALSDQQGNWELLGITPVRFQVIEGLNPFQELYDGVRMLAERNARGALDWQTRLEDIGGRRPPADEEEVSEVEQALREPHTTRFLTNMARDVDWPIWLNTRGYLDALFGEQKLSERDVVLTFWLAQHYAMQHPNVVFGLVGTHNLHINPSLWMALGHELEVSKGREIDDETLKRWVAILLATAPSIADHHVLMWIAERCAVQRLPRLTLSVFLAMSAHRIQVKVIRNSQAQIDPSTGNTLDAECQFHADHWSLNEVWSNHLKPDIGAIAEPLLTGISRQIEDMHRDLMAWDKVTPEWDPISYGRSAIEPHDQDAFPEAVDVLIDSAREALGWLAVNQPQRAESWVEWLIAAEALLLRRLALHGLTCLSNKSTDDRLMWLLRQVGLHDFAMHHEIYRAVALFYATAEEGSRRAVVAAVMSHKMPESQHFSPEEATKNEQFNWLSWLLNARPDCQLAASALAPIKTQYPGWLLRDYPDLTHWMGSADWIGSESPWSSEHLLGRAPGEQLTELLTFEGRRFSGPDRNGLISAIREACKQNTIWAFDLARALAEREGWSSDLWSPVIGGVLESEPGAENWEALLDLALNSALYATHAYSIAALLYGLVRDGGKPFTAQLLEKANVAAHQLWVALESTTDEKVPEDWLSRALNRPAGTLVEFWINGLTLSVQDKTEGERVLPAQYRQWFDLVLSDDGMRGALGRCLLASRVTFLLELDREWTQEKIIPLFMDPESQKAEQAWDGFLVWGRLSPAIANLLLPAFTAALARPEFATENRRRRRLIRLLTVLAVFHIEDPTSEFLPKFFEHAVPKDRIEFASQLGRLLRHMESTARQRVWDAWVRRYWNDRLQSVPAPLHEAEIQQMTEWIPYLGDLFPDAVRLIIRATPPRIEHSQVLFELRTSDLVTRFPEETAELLIFLSAPLAGYQVDFLRTAAGRLPPLPEDLRRRLDDSLARVGIT